MLAVLAEQPERHRVKFTEHDAAIATERAARAITTDADRGSINHVAKPGGGGTRRRSRLSCSLDHDL